VDVCEHHVSQYSNDSHNFKLIKQSLVTLYFNRDFVWPMLKYRHEEKHKFPSYFKLSQHEENITKLKHLIIFRLSFFFRFSLPLFLPSQKNENFF